MVIVEMANNCEYIVFDNELSAKDYAISKFEKDLKIAYGIDDERINEELVEAIKTVVEENYIEDYAYIYTNV